MPEHKGKSTPQWEVQPLRSIEGDVPLPFRVEAADNAVKVELNIGGTVLIRADGTIFNEFGTALCKLVGVERGKP